MRLNKIRPEQLNLLLTIGGLVFHVIFYFMVFMKKEKPIPTSSSSTISEYKMKDLQSRFTTEQIKFQLVQDSLTREIKKQAQTIAQQQLKLKETRKKIQINMTLSWSELSDTERKAYTHYVINKLKQ